MRETCHILRGNSLAELKKSRNVRPLDRNNFTFRRTDTSPTISLFLCTLITLSAQLSSTAAAKAMESLSNDEVESHSQNIDIPPRRQWEANYGYCGEVSLISAGLYYGQYVSQYDARAIASKNADQSAEESQFLLGVNDAYAASQMHLKAKRWNGSAPTANFLSWIKEEVAVGSPVIIGVFKNARSFEESNEPDAGDEHYDHIVLVTGVSSKHAFEPPVYYADDRITFSDHGLWSPTDQPEFIYATRFEDFGANRTQANLMSHPVYSLPNAQTNYGIAITGIIDQDGQTLPVRLTTDVNDEEPIMRDGSSTRPISQDLTLTVTISGMVPGVTYKLYRYNDFQSVPDASFNAEAGRAVKAWEIKTESGTSFSLKEKIRSNQIAVYRAVPITAP